MKKLISISLILSVFLFVGGLLNTEVEALTDDVTVSGDVPLAFTFVSSQENIYFGNFTTANTRFANSTTGSATEVVGHTLTINTNSTDGYTVTYTASPTALTNADSDTITAYTAQVTPSPAAEGWGIKMAALTGSPTIASNYSAKYTFNSGDQVLSSTGVSAHVANVTYVGNIASTTEAGTYSTTITYNATSTI